MLKTNHYLIKGGKLNDSQQANIVGQLLSARSGERSIESFKKGVKSPEYMVGVGQSNDNRIMYPLFYIPPYNEGKKLKTVLNQTPKTHILSANMYELEILRLLFLLAPENLIVTQMVNKTLERLKTTCFGNQDDGLGECFDTSLVVLRFLGTVAQGETKWIQERIDNYNKHINEKKRPSFSLWYFWLCLSELLFNIAEPEILKYKAEMLNWLTNKSCVMNSESDKMMQPVLISMLRNTISKFPEYEYIKDREPYVSDKNGRLYFDMEV